MLVIYLVYSETNAMAGSFTCSLVLGILWVHIIGQTASQSQGNLGVENLDVRKQYELPGSRSVYVLDGALSHQQVLSLKQFMFSNSNWRYVLHDPHSITQEHVYDDNNGIPWKSWQDPTLLRKTDIGQRLNSLVTSIHEKSKNVTAKFELNEVYSAISRRGDRTNLVAEGGKDDDSYHVAMFTNILWRKNGYGELLLYDDDGEILTSIRPKFGRIVIWHSSIPYIFRPASIAQLSTQITIVMSFAANPDINYQKIRYYKSFADDLRRPPSLKSWMQSYKNKPANELDMEKHLTQYRKNKKNAFVAVFDGLFNDASLSAIRAWTIKYGLYFFDDSIDSSSDNVQWIAGLNVDDFVQTDFWPIIHKMATYVSNTTDWYPYDVACNLIRTYDHTRFHLDTSHAREKEMTFLLYLSPNWTSLDYGETAFMETNDDRNINDYVAEVIPIFGRAVIFDGNFPHSAHPPSVLQYNARYTLAVKLSYNKLIAVKKTFSEESRHEPSLGGAITRIQQFMHDPSYHVSVAKMMQVTSHFAAQNLLRKGSGASFHEEERRAGIKRNRDDKVEDVELPFLDPNEMEVPLTGPQLKSLVRMNKYYKVEEPSYTGEMENDPFLRHFDPETREKVIAKWQKVSGGDGDDLNDYLELYLRQRLWLKDYVIGKLPTLL